MKFKEKLTMDSKVVKVIGYSCYPREIVTLVIDCNDDCTQGSYNPSDDAQKIYDLFYCNLPADTFDKLGALMFHYLKENGLIDWDHREC